MYNRSKEIPLRVWLAVSLFGLLFLGGCQAAAAEVAEEDLSTTPISDSSGHSCDNWASCAVEGEVCAFDSEIKRSDSGGPDGSNLGAWYCVDLLLVTVTWIDCPHPELREVGEQCAIIIEGSGW